MAAYTSQLDSGFVPADPYLLVGQMTTTDASRSPAAIARAADQKLADAATTSVLVR